MICRKNVMQLPLSVWYLTIWIVNFIKFYCVCFSRFLLYNKHLFCQEDKKTAKLNKNFRKWIILFH